MKSYISRKLPLETRTIERTAAPISEPAILLTSTCRSDLSFTRQHFFPRVLTERGPRKFRNAWGARPPSVTVQPPDRFRARICNTAKSEKAKQSRPNE